MKRSLVADEIGWTDLAQHLTGPIAVVTSEVDEVSPAKLLVKFAKLKKVL